MKAKVLANKRASILLLCALILSYTFMNMTRNCFSSAMVFIVEEGTMTKSQTGSIVAVFYLVYAFAQLIGGVITDKCSPEHLITLGYVGAGICNLAVYFNQNFTFVMVIWVLNALVQFAIWPAVFKVSSAMLKEEHRGGALFLITFAIPLGMVINYAVAALISDWRLNFLISAVGLALSALIWEAALLGVRAHMLQTELSLPDAPVHTHYDKTQKNISLITLLATSGMLFYFVVMLTRSIFDNGLKTLVATMINENYTTVNPVLATALTIIILVMGALGPTLAHRLYPRVVKNEISATIVLFAIGSPFGILLLLTGKISYWWIVIFLSILVLTMNAALLLSSYIAARFNKWGKGATLASAINTMSSLGIVISNFVFTRTAEISWKLTIWIWVVLLVISNVILFVISPIWKKFLRTKYYY
ncbi:MAG: MFS transporter [Clostridia bacterium]|nr:MFS transporter [Clostridia bacterium]